MTNEKTKPTYEELELEVAKLRAELAHLKRMIFGQKRERFIPAHTDSQMILSEVANIETTQPALKTETISYTRRKPVTSQPVGHGRQALPADLPRKEIVIEPEQIVPGMKKIRDEVTEVLEYVPPSFFVLKYIRPIYALPQEEGVVIGQLPSRPIDKGIAGPGFLAQILIDKYIDHLPLYRQWKRNQRLGIDIPESTMGGWVKACGDLLRPLYECQKDKVLSSPYLMVDETTIHVLDRDKKGKTHLGYYWVYYSPPFRQVFFEYRQGRNQEAPAQTLKTFKGYLQTDGYAGYELVSSQPGITPLACMAHARRYFFDAQPTDSSLRLWMLDHIQALYDIEAQAKKRNLSSVERFQLRQAESIPVLDAMEKWLHENCTRVLPKSDLAKAIGYMMNRWQLLRRYASDGLVEIDNNLVENAIRPIALGRKNYLFAGSHEGAQRAAIIYTLVANAGLANKNPFDYLRDVLSRISDHPFNRLSELLACNYQPLPETAEQSVQPQ